MGTEEAWEGNFKVVVRKGGSSQERELHMHRGHLKEGELSETNATDEGED